MIHSVLTHSNAVTDSIGCMQEGYISRASEQ